MLIVPLELKSLFCRCIELEDSYKKWWLNNNSEWNTNRILQYSSGYIMGLYKDQDSELLSLMDHKYETNELVELICNDFDKTSFEISHIKKRGLGEDSTRKFSRPNADQNLIEWYRNINPCLIAALSHESDERILSFLYIHFLYRAFSREYALRREIEQPNLKKYYDKKDMCFAKWGLISLDKHSKKLQNLEPPRLFDLEKQLTLIVDLPRAFAEVLIDLYDSALIKKLAVRCKDDYIFSGYLDNNSMLETKERGSYFSYDIDSLDKYSQLFDSDYYNDQFWVKVTNTDMTFEELCDDFEVEDNYIVTRMIHLQYKDNLITHLDYELIFYTIDEYNKRLRNMDAHGEQKKRRKYFKADSSTIPFDYPCNCRYLVNDKYEDVSVPFIFFVINCFFTHEDLINEYFHKILK